MGDMAYYANDLNEPMLANLQSKLAWTLAASFLNETPLQGFEPLIAATNGDLSAWTRLTANTLRATLPLSGGAGVLANAISSSQKDIEGTLQEYLKNRLPLFNLTLPEQIDIWTGTPLNDIDNPFLRILNALSPVKVSGTREPWRIWLQEIQFDGLSMLKKDSTGSYEYSTHEREQIYKYIGEMQLYKDIERIMKSPKYKEEIEWLRIHRTTDADLQNDSLLLKKKLLPVYQEIRHVLKNAQKAAEARLLTERPDIEELVDSQQEIDFRMKEGDVPGAAEIQKDNLKTQQLLQYGGSR